MSTTACRGAACRTLIVLAMIGIAAALPAQMRVAPSTGSPTPAGVYSPPGPSWEDGSPVTTTVLSIGGPGSLGSGGAGTPPILSGGVPASGDPRLNH